MIKLIFNGRGIKCDEIDDTRWQEFTVGTIYKMVPGSLRRNKMGVKKCCIVDHPGYWDIELFTVEDSVDNLVEWNREWNRANYVSYDLLPIVGQNAEPFTISFHGKNNECLVKLDLTNMTVEYAKDVEDAQDQAFKIFFEGLRIHGKSLYDRIEELEKEKEDALDAARRFETF